MKKNKLILWKDQLTDAQNGLTTLLTEVQDIQKFTRIGNENGALREIYPLGERFDSKDQNVGNLFRCSFILVSCD